MGELPKTISILGLGAMGQAMAKAYLKNGYRVTVWNRTQAKAEHLIADGAELAKTTPEAIRDNELIIMSLTDYQIMYTVLEPCKGGLAGKTIVNMSSDTPEKVRKAAEWLDGVGANLLSGGIMVPPPLVGENGPHVYSFYSGKKELFETYQSALEIMTRCDYLGEDIGLAMLHYQALLDVIYTAATGALHAYALVKSTGIKATSFEPYLNNVLEFLPELFRMSATAEEIDRREYAGNENNMLTILAGMEQVVQTSNDAGINVSVPHALRQLYDATVLKGYGRNGINSIIEALY